MLAIVDFEPFKTVLPTAVNWKGRSGRFYALSTKSFDDFALSNEELCIIARGSHVMWVGSANEIVADQSSRARFRLALDCADRVFNLPAPSDEVTRMTLIWDLEGGEAVMGLSV